MTWYQTPSISQSRSIRNLKMSDVNLSTWAIVVNVTLIEPSGHTTHRDDYVEMFMDMSPSKFQLANWVKY